MRHNLVDTWWQACGYGAAHLALAICGLALFSPTNSYSQENGGGCGSLQNSFGPFDYRPEKYIPENTYRSHAALLRVVEIEHFTPEVEALRSGHRVKLPGGDIGYLLRAFPNHHRGLMAMARLGEKDKTTQPSGSIYSVECWFDRAVRFRPDDNVARMLYAQFLIKIANQEQAKYQLSVVANQAGENAFTQYNLGLLYFDMKDFDKALVHAQRAYEMGFGNPTLREQLKTSGKWVETQEALPTEAQTPKQ